MQSSKARKGSTRLLIGAAAIAAALTGTALAVQDAWIRLGAQRASAASQLTFVPTDPTKGTVCALRFRVGGASIDVHELTVHFSNHQSMHIAREIKMASNTNSTAVPLPGVRRKVSGVELLYTLPDTTLPPPDVEIWGDTMAGLNYCPR